jgi:hypothetical protein
MTLAAWLWGSRARRNAQRALKPLGAIEPLIDELSPGKSFVDVGAIWNVHGATAFRAEDHGATSVTAMDISAETDEYKAEHARRGSSVRFVHGDLHDAAARERVGVHDVVWCAGVLYHCPNPVHSIECLREMTGETLVLITATAPELPGVQNAAVFFPGLSRRQGKAWSRAYDAALGGGRFERLGLSTPFDPAEAYGNWWWGLAPSAVEGMLEATGFTIAETKTNGFHTRVVARIR